MNHAHPGLWGAGWAGTAIGVVLIAFGNLGADDVASLAGGYGALLTVSALYLLGGLKLRDALNRRSHGAEASSVGRVVARSSSD
ncbi:MAG TPA: hypothetical protein VHK63_08755 [Candidatus Limnocylindria bacterium]|nr:hypothetical protein [Candidatus Limnocylindria bacterium]